MPQHDTNLSRRVIIDLNGYDISFSNRCEHIFEIDTRYDNHDANILRGWIYFAISDIVDLFTINPDTLYGTLNIGPHVEKDYVDPSDGKSMLEIYGDEKTQDFVNEYKTLAAFVYREMQHKLERIINDAIEMGFNDVACALERYRPGAVILRISPIDNSHDRTKY